VSDSLLQRIRRSVEFVPEEPGTIALLLLVFFFLALSPKQGCSFQPEPPAATP